MAAGRVITGYSRPYYRVIGSNDTTAKELARGVDVSVSVDSSDPSVLYADDGVAERAQNEFKSGTISLTIDGMKYDVLYDLFGALQDSAWTTYNKDQKSKPVIFGCIIRLLEDATEYFAPLILPYTIFKKPNISASTQTDTIDFQSATLEGNFYPDPSTGNWEHLWTGSISTEAAALTTLTTKMNAL